MIKRVNSTGRKRIPQSAISIHVHDGSPRTFDALIDFEKFDAPPDAAVVMEAMCAGENRILRFEWGTVDSLVPPESRQLEGLNGRNVFFSVKVVDRTERFGRLLGLAEHVRPTTAGEETETQQTSLLPVDIAPLDHELWRLEFREHEVFLLVNETVPDLADKIRYDGSVYSLIYPAIIREILSEAFRQCQDDEVNSDHWAERWLSFARSLHPEKESPKLRTEVEDQREWIQDVIDVFSQDHGLVDKFVLGRSEMEG